MSTPTTPEPGEQDELLTTMDGERVAPREQRRRAFAWQMYDVGNSAFQAVVVTFVFATYLASDLFLDPEVVALGQADPTNPVYQAAQAGSQQVMSGLDLAAAVIVALLAPALGRTTDGSGRRKFYLALFSGVTIAAMLAMFFVFPDAELLFFGALLLAIGVVFSELAGVNYNAMLPQVATEKNVGRVSGTGWGLGYIGSIVLLLVVLILFIQNFNGDAPGAGIFGVPDGEEGQALNIRLTILVAAIWFIGFLIPLLRRVPEAKQREDVPKITLWRAYIELGRTIARLWRTDRKLLQFLLSSAVFRDGLNAIFAWGAVLAAQVYGFSGSEVMYFAVAANLVAGLGTLLAGRLDDRFGPKPVVIFSLCSMILAGLVLMVTPDTKLSFWIIALVLCLFVGPAQTASRTYLSRAVPAGREGEMFGLYATTGRAAGWLSNLLYFAFISWLMVPKAGVWGILLTIAIGLAIFLTVPARPRVAQVP
ncbi:MFS transporter [Gulosibacter sp. 10]|uniref:MFS transporter n=1 Tax=Gulosibacter sp. 10 TaxID=1255570 RepID=UPI00097ED477|nr:MFS transporter [Gulosibacter sp. 10]SJM54835.1 Permease [Gulosibacter sp. 10]